MPAEGTHNLTGQQADEMQKRYGVRYSTVATGVYGIDASRKQRRRLGLNTAGSASTRTLARSIKSR